MSYCVDGTGDGVVGIGAVAIVVACGVAKLGIGDIDDASCGAVGVWCEGGGIVGAGPGEAREGAT